MRSHSSKLRGIGVTTSDVSETGLLEDGDNLVGVID